MTVSYFVGMKDGENIRFTGEGDQEPGLEPGDIIIVLDEKEHSRFRRHDNDLIMEMDLQLVEALCGFHKTIETLDKRMLVLTNLPGMSFYGMIYIMGISPYKSNPRLCNYEGHPIKNETFLVV